jgi:hypothetical protein
MTLCHPSYGHPHGLVSSDPTPDLSLQRSTSLTYRGASYDSAKNVRRARANRYENQTRFASSCRKGRKGEAGAGDLRTLQLCRIIAQEGRYSKGLAPPDPYLAQLT